MKWTQTFIPTLKESPKEAEVTSHKLMLRAGIIQNLSSGLYIYLPLGKKILDKVMAIIRDELDSKGAIELSMPVLQPKSVWEKTGRWDLMADLMMRIKDREDKEFVLGPTHEEIITDLVAKRVNSYKQLPLNFYQIQTKFRDEIRPRFGVIRAKEFIMKDGYSFDLTKEDAFKSYDSMFDAYKRIFKRCGLKVSPVEADTGVMGDGGKSHEFMAVTDIGEDSVVTCDKCEYAANAEAAVRKIKDTGDENNKDYPAMEIVDTVNITTIEDVAEFFKVSKNKLIKALIYKYDKQFVTVLIRGDVSVNEVKLKKYLKVSELMLAEDKDVLKITKASTGYAGPIGLKNTRIVADLSLLTVKCGVTGANQNDKHYQNVVAGRDFRIDELADIGVCKEGDLCANCGNELLFGRGIEVGQVFFLGKKYSEKLKASVLDENGVSQTLIMGCYGIGVSRTVAAIIECNNDEAGIKWPISVAPFEVLITPLDLKDESVNEYSFKLYQDLKNKGIDVLIDDRNERAGVKFKDAELIGIPLRVTVGKRTLKDDVVEVVERDSLKKELVSITDSLNFILNKVETLKKNVL